PAGLDIRRVPWLGAERAQERRRMKRAGADFQIERLDQHAALARPELVEPEDQFLKGRRSHAQTWNFNENNAVIIGAEARRTAKTPRRSPWEFAKLPPAVAPAGSPTASRCSRVDPVPICKPAC